MDENELSAIAVDIAYRIHKELGPGLLESATRRPLVMNYTN